VDIETCFKAKQALLELWMVKSQFILTKNDIISTTKQVIALNEQHLLVMQNKITAQFHTAIVCFYPNEYNVQGHFVHEKYLLNEEEFRALILSNFPGMKEWVLYKVESDGSLRLLSANDQLRGIYKFAMIPREVDASELRFSPPSSSSCLIVSEGEFAVAKKHCMDAPFPFTPRWNGRGGTVIKKSKPHSPFESVDLDSKYTMKRERLLQSILDRLGKDPVVLVHGPPSCGKTSTSALLEEFTLQRLPGIRVVLVSVLCIIGMEDLHVDDVWLELFGVTFHRWIIEARQIESIIIFDGVQKLYSSEGFGTFWDTLKACLQVQAIMRVRFVLFATYRYRGALHGKWTTVDIPERFCIGLPELCFDETETKEYISRYFEAHSVSLENDDMAGRLLFNLTSGHPGVCSNIVDSVLNQMFPKIRQSVPEHCVLSTQDLAKYLCSNRIYYSIFQYRAFNKLERVDRFEYFAEVKKLFNEGSLRGEVPHLPQMLTDGIIRPCADGESFIFFCPVAALCVKKFFLGSATEGQYPNTLKELVMETCQNMSKETLCSLLGRSQSLRTLSTPPKRLLKMEFWRSAFMVLDWYTSISPDAGSFFGTNGFLDFTILCHRNYYTKQFDSFWGIEILCEGEKIPEQGADIAGLQGHYRDNLLTDFLVVDFCSNPPSDLSPSVLYVVYSDDFSKFTLMGSGFKQTCVELK
jgi:hypothetical protein